MVTGCHTANPTWFRENKKRKSSESLTYEDLLLMEY
jgi:hypothetical protein